MVRAYLWWIASTPIPFSPSQSLEHFLSLDDHSNSWVYDTLVKCWSRPSCSFSFKTRKSNTNWAFHVQVYISLYVNGNISIYLLMDMLKSIIRVHFLNNMFPFLWKKYHHLLLLIWDWLHYQFSNSRMCC